MYVNCILYVDEVKSQGNTGDPAIMQSKSKDIDIFSSKWKAIAFVNVYSHK